MRKPTIILYGAAIVTIVAAAVTLGVRSHNTTNTQIASLTPSPTASQAPSPTSQVYSNTSIGVSFNYPAGYYVVEKPATHEVDISNYKDVPTGTAPADFQLVGISYDITAAAYESVVSKAKGSELTSVPVTGGTIRLYTYTNPSYANRTLAMAFFSGKYSFTINMGWDAYNSAQSEADIEAAEVTLMKEVVPTITIQ